MNRGPVAAEVTRRTGRNPPAYVGGYGSWPTTALSLLPAVGLFLGHAAPNRWEVTEGGRHVELTLPVQGKAGFTLLAPHETGVIFTNRVEDLASAANRVLENGAGVAADDYDRDGLPDLFFCSLQGNNTLYRNLGNWRFEDVTAEARTASKLGATTLALADVDGNGTLDLYVATYRAEDARDSALIQVQTVNGRMALHPKHQGRLFLTTQGLFE